MVATRCTCGGDLLLHSFTGTLARDIYMSERYLDMSRTDFQLSDVQTRCVRCGIKSEMCYEMERPVALHAEVMGAFTIKDQRGNRIDMDVFRDPITNGVFAIEADMLKTRSDISSPFGSGTLLELPEPVAGIGLG